MKTTTIALAAALTLGGAARAADSTSYPASYFAAAQPFSALDMVQRLPGFTLKEGDADVRGLSGAGGNVLIDGERPATKQESLSDLLRRIPAASVERIEILRGGADLQGESVVANVVRLRRATTSGQVEASLFAYRDGRVAPALSLRRGLQTGDRRIEGSVRLYREIEDDKGTGPRRRLSSTGDVLRDASLREDAASTGASLKGSYEDRMLGGKLTAHAAFDEDRQRTEIAEQRTFPDPRLTMQTEEEDLRSGELGASFDGRLGGDVRLTITGVQRLSRTVAEEQAVTGEETELFTSRANAGESILGGTVQRTLGETLKLEGGIEGAFTFLDGEVALEENGEPLDLPTANVRVEELRGEAFAAAHWRARPNLAIDAALRAETSELRQSGDAQLRKRLTYAKPRLAAALDIDDRRQLRLRLEREVGQLDFEDFTSSASLSAGTVSAGNKDLEPQTQWVAEAEFEQRFGKESAVVLSLRHIAIDNVVDRIPVSANAAFFDATGNIGRGTLDEAQITFTVPLAFLPGALLGGEVTYRQSSVTDPTTGKEREISEVPPLEGELSFTQDLSRFRWGAELELAEEEPEYRFDEVRVSTTDARLSLFAEWTLPSAWRLRVDAENLTSGKESRTRDIYDGPRSAAAFDYRETRILDIGPYVGVTLRRSY